MFSLAGVVICLACYSPPRNLHSHCGNFVGLMEMEDLIPLDGANLGFLDLHGAPTTAFYDIG
jgi:hypothetical protein